MADDGATSSSSAKSYFIYDVFLSFRGVDTRHGFTDHLFKTLVNRGIKAFRDDPNLRFGDEIRPTLLEAIERSRMSIVVFSQRYASSAWCLDELVKIVECKDKGRLLFPIFYHVEPSQVRNQKNQYEIDMMNHENGGNSHKVQAWRLALSGVGNQNGRHYKGDRLETDFINEICEEILKYLPRELLHIKHPFELDSRFEEVKSLLDVESHDTLFMLCIYGDGETDKTSFVGELCNMVFHKFEVAHLLENVSEKSKESIKGLEELQKTLLSMIDREEKPEIGSKLRGSLEIQRRLCNRRVLLILDDVDSIQQLEFLAGGRDWFGPGSRIIITTRDEDVANKFELDGVEIKKYCVDECDFEVTEVAKSNNKQKWGVEEGDIIGFDDSLSIVVDQLKKEDSFRNVVSITGMGGLGKTTLAQKVYNNNEVKNLFPCRAWSCVSKDFRERKVFLDILSSLKPSSSKYENLSEQELKEEVRKCLNKNKYLVVLDDVWEPEVWDNIKDVFPKNNNGSMMLITSRNEQVAYYTRSRSPHHQLSPLNAEESWELFCRKVFGGEECPPYLEHIGKSIVERCGGLPLAVITLAGLVAKKDRTYTEWSQIKEFIPWYLAEDSTKVIDVLKVSYDNLPEILKPCFLYFGIYPEDHTIFARELIQLWMAEGFIQPQKIRTSKIPRPEDVGEKYLNELVDRNLVHVVRRRSDGGVKICRIHDLLRELCILESKVDNFLGVRPEFANNSLRNAGRLCLLCNEPYYMSVFKSSQFTYSLFFFAGVRCYADYIREIFPFSQVVHVARGVGFRECPCDFTKMSHLKYLRIGASHRVGKIPDCIWSRCNLETLDLRGCPLAAGQDTISIWKLERLRHLYVRFFVKLEVDKEGANSKQMWNLQTLSQVDVEPQTMLLVNNGCFPNLTKLGLFHNPNLDHHLPHEQLWNLHHLSKLRTLKINCSSARFSLDGIVFPSNISKITLTNFDRLDPSCMSALGRIPNLQILKLVDGWSGTVVCSAAVGDFPQLQVFHIERLRYGIRMALENGAMPHLQRMVIRHCKFRPEDIPKRLLSLCDLS